MRHCLHANDTLSEEGMCVCVCVCVVHSLASEYSVVFSSA